MSALNFLADLDVAKNHDNSNLSQERLDALLEFEVDCLNILELTA